MKGLKAQAMPPADLDALRFVAAGIHPAGTVSGATLRGLIRHIAWLEDQVRQLRDGGRDAA